MISQPVSSIFPCSALPSGTLRTPGLSIPWCCLPTSSSLCLVFVRPFTEPCKIVLARPDERETWPYRHFSLRLFAMVRGSFPSGPRWLTFSRWGWYGLCHRHKLTKLANSFLFCSCVCFCLTGPFNSTSYSPDNSSLSHSVLLVLILPYWSFICLFIKVSLSPDIILCGWHSLNHQLTN